MRAFIRPFFIVMRKRTQVFFSEKNLLYTNIAISGSISLLGDVVQQLYQKSKHSCDTGRKWEVARTFQMAGAGVVSGPFTHYWYYYLDKFFPGRSIRTVFIKLFLDQFVCSPIYIALFLISTGVLEGQTWEEFKQEVRDKTLGLLSVEFLVWPPAQFINFFFLPTQFRVLYDNLVSLFAEALYSYVRFDYGSDSDSEKCEVGDNENAEMGDDSVTETTNKFSVLANQSTYKDTVESLNEQNLKQNDTMSHTHTFVKQRSFASYFSDNMYSSCLFLDS